MAAHYNRETELADVSRGREAVTLGSEIVGIEASGQVPLALAAAGLLLVAACAIGRGLRFGWPPVSDMKGRTLLDVALGLNGLGLIALLLGSLPAIGPHGRIAALVAVSFVAMGAGIRNRRLARSDGATRSPEPRVAASFFRDWLWAGPLFLTLGPALTLPTGWDELVYRCVVPRRWMAEGTLQVDWDLPYSGFPALQEILHWTVAPIESLVAPKLISWGCWVLGLGLLRAVVLSRAPGWGGHLLFLSFALAPASLMIGANCYAETLLLMDLAALLWLAETAGPAPVARTGWRFPWLAGLLSGGAAAVKLTGLPFLLIGPLIVFSRSPGPRRTKWAQGAACFATALLFCAPFYVRPWLATANPFFPYLERLFTDDPGRLAMSEYHNAIGGNFGFRSGPGFVAAPILLAFQERLYDGSFGWQWLVVLALVGWGLARRSTRSSLPRVEVAAAGLLYGFWYLTAQQARFAIPAMAALLPTAAAGLGALSVPMQRAVTTLLCGLALWSLPWKTAGYYVGSWETLAGVWSWRDYVDDGTDGIYVPVVEAVRDRTPAEAHLLLFLEHRSLYLPRRCTIGTPFFQPRGLSGLDSGSADDLGKRLDTLEVTHLLLARMPIGPDRDAEWFERMTPVLAAIESGIRRGDLVSVWESESHVLLEWRPRPTN